MTAAVTGLLLPTQEKWLDFPALVQPESGHPGSLGNETAECSLLSDSFPNREQRKGTVVVYPILNWQACYLELASALTMSYQFFLDVFENIWLLLKDLGGDHLLGLPPGGRLWVVTVPITPSCVPSLRPVAGATHPHACATAVFWCNPKEH